MRGKLLVVSDWLINGSLIFYPTIATPFAKGGQLLKRSGTSLRDKLGLKKQMLLLMNIKTQACLNDQISFCVLQS